MVTTQIANVKKQDIYDNLCRVLTDYEGNGEPENEGNAQILYNMLVEIQNNWENIVGV